METKLPEGHTNIKTFLEERAKGAQIYTGVKNTIATWNTDRLRSISLLSDPDSSTRECFQWLHEKYFTGAKKVLDIGCGNGLNVFSLRLNMDIDVTGIDGSATMIALCNELKTRNNIDKVSFFECLAEDMSMFTDNSFDVAFSQHALEHFTCPEKALLEMKRVARNVCGFLPFANASDSKEHLFHWDTGTINELLKKVFDQDKIEVRKFGSTILGYGGTK